MLSKFEFKLGYKWLLSKKNRNPTTLKGLLSGSIAFSALSLGLSLIFLSLTLAIVSGFENTLAKAVANSQGHVLHQLSKWKSYEELNGWMAKIPSPEAIQRVEFFWTSQGLLVGEKAGRGILIEGRTIWGNDDEINSSNSELIDIQLGSALADILGVGQNSKLKVLLPGIIEGSVEVRVKKIVHLGMYDVESRYAVIDARGLSKYVQVKFPKLFQTRPGDAHGVRYFLKPNFDGVSALGTLQDWVREYQEYLTALDPDFMRGRIQTWRDQKASLFKGIGYNKIELALILAILVMVASLNIGATFVVLFLERDREFSILQAIGWSAKSMRRWMLGLGVLVGFVISTGALLLAPFLGKLLQSLKWTQLPEEIYNIKYLPLNFENKEILAIWAYGVLCTVFVSWVLGWRLSRVSLMGILNHRRM